jgi:hypothetical protein
VQHHHGTTATADGAAASTGFPALPRPTPLVVLLGLLLALAAGVTLRATDDAPEPPHRRWRAPDPPRRGPPLLLAP